jgi:hypothetical protein
MALTNEQKILIFVAIVMVVVYMAYNKCSEPKKIREPLAGDIGADSDQDTQSSDSSASTETSATASTAASTATASTASTASSQPVTEIRRGKNANTEPTPKQVSYKDGKRGGPSDLDRFFINGNVENAAENNEFGPADYVSDKLAAYTAKKTDEGLLPVEEKDWFEDVTPTKIKNRHLINIYRPVGVNTISTSLKNPSLDIRGAPANPKTVVSPFLNSSIEPDLNIKGLCV